MKTFAQIVLSILFMPLFLISLFSYTFKFQILNVSFLEKAFENYGTYQSLTNAAKVYVEDQIVKGGGKASDSKILTDTITTPNIKVFVNKNLKNILSFVNSQSSEIVVYLPIDKMPQDLLPRSVIGLSENITLESLLIKLNIKGVQNLPLNTLSTLGQTLYYLFIISCALSLFTILVIYLLAAPGKRLVALGITFLILGIILIPISFFPSESVFMGQELIQIIIASTVPAILRGILVFWRYVGTAVFLLGIIFLFLKKPYKK